MYQAFNGPVGMQSGARPDTPPVPDVEVPGPPTSLVKKSRRSNLTLLTKVSKAHRKGCDFHQFGSLYHLLTPTLANSPYTFIEDAKKRTKIYSKLTNDITKLVHSIPIWPTISSHRLLGQATAYPDPLLRNDYVCEYRLDCFRTYKIILQPQPDCI